LEGRMIEYPFLDWSIQAYQAYISQHSYRDRSERSPDPALLFWFGAIIS
jgi:hypothetical protein